MPSKSGSSFDRNDCGGRAVPFRVPHPLVAHGANAALGLFRVGDAAEGCGDHVAVFEGSDEAVALVGVVAQPVEELGEAPLVGVDAAAPLDGFEVLAVGELGDLLCFFLGAVVAPEVVVVEWLEIFADGEDAGAGGVERYGFDLLASMAASSIA